MSFLTNISEGVDQGVRIGGSIAALKNQTEESALRQGVMGEQLQQYKMQTDEMLKKKKHMEAPILMDSISQFRDLEPEHRQAAEDILVKGGYATKTANGIETNRQNLARLMEDGSQNFKLVDELSFKPRLDSLKRKFDDADKDYTKAKERLEKLQSEGGKNEDIAAAKKKLEEHAKTLQDYGNKRNELLRARGDKEGQTSIRLDLIQMEKDGSLKKVSPYAQSILKAHYDNGDYKGYLEAKMKIFSELEKDERAKELGEIRKYIADTRKKGSGSGSGDGKWFNSGQVDKETGRIILYNRNGDSKLGDYSGVKPNKAPVQEPTIGEQMFRRMNPEQIKEAVKKNPQFRDDAIKVLKEKGYK